MSFSVGSPPILHYAGRASNNLVSKPLDPVVESDQEGSNSQSKSGLETPEERRISIEEERIFSLEGTVGAIAGTVLDLSSKFDKMMEEMSRSRREIDNFQQKFDQTFSLHNSKIASLSTSTIPVKMNESVVHTPSMMNPAIFSHDNSTVGIQNISQGGQSSPPLLPTPEYDGEGDVEEWLMRANHYFQYYNVPEIDRIKVCSVQLKGTAVYWLHWIMRIKNGIMTWEEFCKNIRMEFGPSQFTDHMIELKLLKQEGSVHEYNSQFQKLSNRVQSLPENCSYLLALARVV